MSAVTAADLTRDAFLGDRLRLWQPRAGYRAAIDPVLLAAFAPARAGTRVLDLGCGVGTAALCLAARVPGLALSGLELQPAYAELARRNAVENAVAFDVHEGDVGNPPRALIGRDFDLVLLNPPYHPAPAASPARDPGRDRAQREGEARLCAWVDAGLRRLAPGGVLALVHLASRLGAILSALEGRAGGADVLPVAPRAGLAASRVLVRARKGGRGPLTLHPPLVLHAEDAGGGYSLPAQAVLRDAADLLAQKR